MTSVGHGASSQEPPTVTFDQVRQAELEQIAKRRKVAFGGELPPVAAIQDDLTGLALSGGGIRSAAMSLGLLQALQERGDLKHFDYLSTVSGGGYAGAYLSTSALALKSAHNAHPSAVPQSGGTPTSAGASPPVAHAAQTDDDCVVDRLPLACLTNGRQPPGILRFMFEGRYLRRPFAFGNRYLASSLLMLALTISVLAAFASLTAWTYAQLWQPQVAAVLGALRRSSDIEVALFPSFVMLVLWSVAWGVSVFRYGVRTTGATARVLFFLLLFVFAVGIAGLFGTGDISLHVEAIAGTDSRKQTVNTFEETLKVIVYSLIGASLLPYLSPKNLIRSGVSPRNTLERATFWLASRALVVGIPFVFIAYFARENISGFNEDRGYEVYSTEIADWQRHNAWAPFWRRIWADQENHDPIAEAIWRRVVEASPSGNETPFAELEARVGQMKDYFSNHASYGRGWWHFGQFLVNRLLNADTENSEFYKYYDNYLESRRIKQRFADALTGTLRDQNFFRTFRTGKRTWPDDQEVRLSTASILAVALEKSNPTDKVRLETEILENNRKLLEAHYSGNGYFRDRSEIFAYVVLNHDQEYRWTCFEVSAAIFLLLLVAVNLNGTSLHGFYAEEIGRMWLADVPEDSAGDVEMSQLDTTAAGCPYHLVSATWHRFGRRSDTGTTGRRDHFLFSHRYCGTDDLGYAATTRYMNGDCKFTDAIAISGAAVNPMQFQQPLVRVLLFLANLRLGQWVESPSRRLRPLVRFLAIRPAAVLANMLFSPERRWNCFVSDGGLYENLGIEPLLRRRCRRIVALDATEDAAYSFADLTKLLRWASVRYGVRFEPCDAPGQPIDLARLVPCDPGKTGRPEVVVGVPGSDGTTDFRAIKVSQSHHLIWRIVYPENEGPRDAWLVYLKSSLTGDEPPTVLGRRRTDAEFPNNPSTNQFFDAATFDAYRALGYHMWQSVRRADGPGGHARGLDEFVAALTGKLANGATPTQPPHYRDIKELERILRILAKPNASAEDREAAMLELAGGNFDPKSVIPALVAMANRRGDFRFMVPEALAEYARRDLECFVAHFENATTASTLEHLAWLAQQVMARDKRMDSRIIEVLARLVASDQPPIVRHTARETLHSYCTQSQAFPVAEENLRRAKQALDRAASEAREQSRPTDPSGS